MQEVKMTIHTNSASNPTVLANDVFCPDGHHRTNQQWTASELRHLLDMHEPLFHCDDHAYRWNPDPADAQQFLRLANEMGSDRVN
jgi:hypothetical protein